jgi:hypothetical protein
LLASKLIQSIKARLGKRKTKTRKPAENVSLELSQFGRIPLATFRLLSSHSKDVSGRVACYLPLDISKELRDFTVREVLATLFDDWLENGNDEPLSAQDIEDFGSFVELSCELSGIQNHPDSLEKSAIYKASLRALLQEWLDKWNAADASGAIYPPG